MRYKALWFALIYAAVALTARGAEDPFSVRPTLTRTPAGQIRLHVAFTITRGHYLYAEDIRIEASDGVRLSPLTLPPPHQKYDPFEEKNVAMYDKDMTFVYGTEDASPDAFTLTVKYRGCSEKECFFPATRTFPLSLSPSSSVPASSPADTPPPAPPLAPATAHRAHPELPGDFHLIGRASGYLPPVDFIAFLDKVESGKGMDPDRLQTILERYGLLAAILAILLGGLGLNLTPCVLPMIPINLAIIGAGAQAGSKARGFILGGVYGIGIAFVYGILGLVVVLTGSKFGQINASPMFNLGISALFLVLALAMFGVFNLDFSRFQAQGGAAGRKAGFASSFAMGCVAALLAGACVAPVVISVLLLSARLYAGGNTAGLLLPFLLGVGMALPWPFAGAGLSFLPKPGRWMEWVKYVFGVLILAMAVYYGYTGFGILRNRSELARGAPGAHYTATHTESDSSTWLDSLEKGLALARETGRPVFVDCWASWCKNCLVMDETTFKDPLVIQRLAPYVRVKFRAEDMNDPAVRPILDRFGVLGLPTYVVLTRKQAP